VIDALHTGREQKNTDTVVTEVLIHGTEPEYDKLGSTEWFEQFLLSNSLADISLNSSMK
jgi:hypothetical protein